MEIIKVIRAPALLVNVLIISKMSTVLRMNADTLDLNTSFPHCVHEALSVKCLNSDITYFKMLMNYFEEILS